MKPLTIVDTHAHLCDDILWPERTALIQNAIEAGVGAVVSVGYNLETSRRCMELSEDSPRVSAAVGIHPNNLEQARPADFEQIAEWAANPEVIAIGETGLDYFHRRSTPDRQKEALRWHLSLARHHNLPVILHTRAAEEDVLDEIERLPPRSAVLHCYGGSASTAERAVEMGLWIGVGGPVTFSKAVDLQELVRRLPIEKIVVETDCPYLSPHPFRGKRNEPARTRLVAEKVAELRGMSVEELAKITTENADRLFPRLRAEGKAGVSV